MPIFYESRLPEDDVHHIAHDFEHRFLRRHGEILVAAMAIDEELADLSDDGGGFFEFFDRIDSPRAVSVRKYMESIDLSFLEIKDLENLASRSARLGQASWR